MRSVIFLFVLCLTVNLLDCHQSTKSQNGQDGSKKSVKTKVNNLEVEFLVETPEIESNNEFLAKAIFTNRSDSDLRLNALFLDFAPILIKIRRQDGTRVNPTSPPFPPEDDGIVGREVIKPGESETFIYRGVDLFGEDLSKGKYQVRFRYENSNGQNGDWVGVIETEWLDFAVVKKKER